MFGWLRQRLPYERKDAGGYEVLTGGALPTAAGVSVSPETAMGCSVAFACVKVIAETVEQLTPHLYRKKGPDDRERATDHPVYPLVTQAANPWTPASEFRLVLGTHFATYGNAYAFVNRDGAGRVAELIPLDPRTVSVRQDPRTMVPVYTVATGAGLARDYDRSEILHIRGVGLDVHKGASPVTLAREAIGLSLTLETHCGGLFGRGAKPSGILKHKRKVTPELMKKLRVSFTQWFGGAANAGKTLILEEDMDFQQLQLSSVDAQTLEMRRFQVEEVSRFWRVPLHMVGEMDRATHANAESMGQQFLTFCMLPILRLWCDALAITLLTPEERGEYYFEFLVDDLARADIAARFEAYSKAINAGVLNPNEARSMENRAPYAGGETFMRPVNTAPAPTNGTTSTEAGNGAA
ncbi:phage portal protein [Azospirillum fermentarium]|uniref:phage portal protein n=1 Tax=Azospirillum fermentarium TaxID=1233114 RepID=UPI0022262E68|nr:phage portal protein [Azospirillum fermentarium]